MKTTDTHIGLPFRYTLAILSVSLQHPRSIHTYVCRYLLILLYARWPWHWQFVRIFLLHLTHSHSLFALNYQKRGKEKYFIDSWPFWWKVSPTFSTVRVNFRDEIKERIVFHSFFLFFFYCSFRLFYTFGSFLEQGSGFWKIPFSRNNKSWSRKGNSRMRDVFLLRNSWFSSFY